MLKVFLVEDEFVVREGIKNNIDWTSHGYEFCGEASDGELAYSMIQKVKPDIVITDIKMPFMDGLMLSKLIKKEMPWIEIIILTGYEEFEYAKEAIKLGIAQYLSKPIKGEDLLKAVDEVGQKIQEKIKEREIREKFEREMEENILKERKDFFQYLVTGAKSAAETLEMAEELKIDLSSMWYSVVLFKIQPIEKGEFEYSDSMVEAEEELRVLNKRNLIIFERNLEGKALIFKADSEEELLDIQREYLKKVEVILKKYSNIRYFGGLGNPVNRISEIPQSFENASRAFAHRYLIQESRIVAASDIENVSNEADEFNISNIDTKQIDRAKIKEFLKLGNKSEAVYFVEEFFRGLSTNAMKSNIFRQYITMDAFFAVADFVESLQASKEEIEPLDVASGALRSEEDAKEYLIRIIGQALEIRDRATGNRYDNIVEDVKRYIEANYAQEDLSLNIIAAHVNFSPNHLSTVFSQQTGQTFIKYLTDYRMNKAKELLRCSGKRSSEISIEVGYKDSHYFSYLFKKTQGVTPTQYRGGKGLEGDE